jgi:hypothetical protein
MPSLLSLLLLFTHEKEVCEAPIIEIHSLPASSLGYHRTKTNSRNWSLHIHLGEFAAAIAGLDVHARSVEALSQILGEEIMADLAEAASEREVGLRLSGFALGKFDFDRRLRSIAFGVVFRFITL